MTGVFDYRYTTLQAASIKNWSRLFAMSCEVLWHMAVFGINAGNGHILSSIFLLFFMFVCPLKAILCAKLKYCGSSSQQRTHFFFYLYSFAVTCCVLMVLLTRETTCL